MKPLLLALCLLATACGKRVETEAPRIEKVSDGERTCWRIRDDWVAGRWVCEVNGVRVEAQ